MDPLFIVEIGKQRPVQAISRISNRLNEASCTANKKRASTIKLDLYDGARHIEHNGFHLCDNIWDMRELNEFFGRYNNI